MEETRQCHCASLFFSSTPLTLRLSLVILWDPRTEYHQPLPVPLTALEVFHGLSIPSQTDGLGDEHLSGFGVEAISKSVEGEFSTPVNCCV
jgi:hypothetical protein